MVFMALHFLSWAVEMPTVVFTTMRVAGSREDPGPRGRMFRSLKSPHSPTLHPLHANHYSVCVGGGVKNFLEVLNAGKRLEAVK